MPWSIVSQIEEHRKNVYYIHTTPLQPLRPLLLTMLQHLTPLLLMTGGRTRYTLPNARCNKTLPGLKKLPPKDLAHVGQDTKTTYLGSGLLTGFDEV